MSDKAPPTTEELELLALLLPPGSITKTECPCKHPSCDQYTLNVQGSVGFEENIAVAIEYLPALIAEVLAARRARLVAEVEETRASIKTIRAQLAPPTNVVNLPVITALDLPPERLLATASEESFERITIIGVTSDGDEYFAASAADGGTALWDMERAKLRLLTIGENNG